MRISDWSSDVCSSDLTRRGNLAAPFPATEQFRQAVALFLDQCRDALAHGGDGLALLQRGLALLDLGQQCVEFADGKCGNIGRHRVTPAKYQCVDHIGIWLIFHKPVPITVPSDRKSTRLNSS